MYDRVARAKHSAYVPDTELTAALALNLHAPFERSRLFLDGVMEQVFGRVSKLQRSGFPFKLCYSVKTNPRPEILACARRHAFFAEVISPQEFEHARSCGFGPEQIVYNGPYPATYCSAAPGVIFADSLEAFVAAARVFPQSLIGARVRPPGIDSHFGIETAQLGALIHAAKQMRRSEIGLSFHVRPEDYGRYDWRSLALAFLEMAHAVDSQSGVPVTVVDAGGGKTPQEFDAAIAARDFEWMWLQARERLPAVRSLLYEPGQELATPLEAVVAPVLEVRRNGSATEIVVDAGYPDIPQMSTFAHRLFLACAGAISPVRSGGCGRILGRTCLEYDILAAGVRLDECGADDALIVADAGAYDASMSFAFSSGLREEAAVR